MRSHRRRFVALTVMLAALGTLIVFTVSNRPRTAEPVVDVSHGKPHIEATTVVYCIAHDNKLHRLAVDKHGHVHVERCPYGDSPYIP